MYQNKNTVYYKMTDMVSSPNTVSSPRVKKQATIWEPLQNNEVMKDAKCTIGNEFLIFCNREGARDALNLNFSDIENEITQCYMGETVVCNIKKDTELATLSAGISAVYKK
jgi:hypothetical protein